MISVLKKKMEKLNYFLLLSIGLIGLILAQEISEGNYVLVFINLPAFLIS